MLFVTLGTGLSRLQHLRHRDLSMEPSRARVTSKSFNLYMEISNVGREESEKGVGLTAGKTYIHTSCLVVEIGTSKHENGFETLPPTEYTLGFVGYVIPAFMLAFGSMASGRQ